MTIEIGKVTWQNEPLEKELLKCCAKSQLISASLAWWQ